MRTTYSERSSFAIATQLRARAAFAVDDDLHDAAAIAQIDEDQLTEVAMLLHPAVRW